MGEEVIQLIQQRDRVVTGLLRGLVVLDGLDLSLQVPGVSAAV